MTLKIWLLKLNEKYCHWDCNVKHVIRATTESNARRAAAGAARGEDKELWLNPKKSTCKHVKVNNFGGVSAIILTDYQAE